MALESVTNIADLVVTNPLAGDPVGEGDDHVRNLKVAVKSLLTNFAQLGGTAPKWQKVTIAETALTDADTSEDESLITLTQFEKVVALCIKHSAAFTGGTLTAMTVSVGTTADPTYYAPAHDIFIAPGDAVKLDRTGFSSKTMAAAGHSLIARFTSTGDNVVNAVAGSVDIWICTVKME